jgi:hypothetical protein
MLRKGENCPIRCNSYNTVLNYRACFDLVPHISACKQDTQEYLIRTAPQRLATVIEHEGALWTAKRNQIQR